MKMNHYGDLENNYQSKPSRTCRAKAEDESPTPTVWTGHSGGTEVGGMIRSMDEISRDLSTRGDQTPTIGPSGTNREAGAASGEVGGSDSSVDLWDIITHGERSGATRGYATETIRDKVTARWATSADEVRELRPTLYRNLKTAMKASGKAVCGKTACTV